MVWSTARYWYEGIDWDKIEDAVRDYGDLNYDEGNSIYGMTRKDHERAGFDATMVKIHNEIRKAQIGGDQNTDPSAGAFSMRSRRLR